MKTGFLFISVLLISIFSNAQDFNIEDGPYKEYHENGQLKTSGEYKNKKRIGKWKDYYDSGELYKEYNYTKGKYNGLRKRFFKNGVLKSETTKLKGKLFYQEYYESGKLFCERILEEGYYKEYFENGTLKIESNYLEDELSGVWRRFFITGEVEWEVIYKEGYKEGSYKQFYKNGKLKTEGNNIKNKKEGKEKRYLENGVMEWTGSYKNNVFNKVWNRFDVSGNKIESKKYKKGVLLKSNEKFVLTATSVPDGIIEKTPVYPGCEKALSNKVRKRCMSNKISQFVNENFNTNIGLVAGKQHAWVVFKVDKQGEVIDVIPKSKHAGFKYEAFRVISLLPKMEPGMLRGKAVVVPFSLPIIFQIQKKMPNFKKSNENPNQF